MNGHNAIKEVADKVHKHSGLDVIRFHDHFDNDASALPLSEDEKRQEKPRQEKKRKENTRLD